MQKNVWRAGFNYQNQQEIEDSDNQCWRVIKNIWSHHEQSWTWLGFRPEYMTHVLKARKCRYGTTGLCRSYLQTNMTKTPVQNVNVRVPRRNPKEIRKNHTWFRHKWMAVRKYRHRIASISRLYVRKNMTKTSVQNVNFLFQGRNPDRNPQKPHTSSIKNARKYASAGKIWQEQSGQTDRQHDQDFGPKHGRPVTPGEIRKVIRITRA